MLGPEHEPIFGWNIPVHGRKYTSSGVFLSSRHLLFLVFNLYSSSGLYKGQFLVRALQFSDTNWKVSCSFLKRAHNCEQNQILFGVCPNINASDESFWREISATYGVLHVADGRFITHPCVRSFSSHSIWTFVIVYVYF